MIEIFGQKTNWTSWRKKVLRGMRDDARDPIGHLGPEAIVAYVDEEMDTASRRRAEYHFARCAECRSEAFAQRGTSEWLKRSTQTCPVHVPESLVAKLAGLERTAAGPDGLAAAEAGDRATTGMGDPAAGGLDGDLAAAEAGGLAAAGADETSASGVHPAPRQSLKSTLGAVVRTFRNQNGQ